MKYKEVAIKELSPDANTAGVRAGICTMLACRMPDYLAVCTTGHDMTDPVPSQALPITACLTPTNDSPN